MRTVPVPLIVVLGLTTSLSGADVAFRRMPGPVIEARSSALQDSPYSQTREEASPTLARVRDRNDAAPACPETGQPGFSVDPPLVRSIGVPTYPDTVSDPPDLPSPFATPDGQEWVVTRTKANRFAIVPVALENSERKGRQRWVNAKDFPALAARGLHDSAELARVHTITGRSCAEVTELARPGGLSDAGFLAADEDIVSVLRGDNDLVTALGLTHPDLARPLFHVWNLIITDLDLRQWNMREHKWQNMPVLHYRGRTIHLEAGDTKGGQRSVFADGLEGAFWIHIHRALTGEEEALVERRYRHLGARARGALVKRLTRIETGEMEAYYIMGYGFYEGHTEWRTDPIAIALIFGLRSLEEIEAAFPGQLDRVLQTHFRSPRRISRFGDTIVSPKREFEGE